MMNTAHLFSRLVFGAILIVAALLLLATASRAGNTTAQTITADYDRHLCRFAQQFLINAGKVTLPIVEQTGHGNGFHVIQMDVDAKKRQLLLAMATDFAEIDETRLATYVSCKMVDRNRVNDVLGLQLPKPDHQCREVNEQTYARALANLSVQQRSEYLAKGRQLTFGDDVILATGGEWLPVTMDAFIQPSETPAKGVRIHSPSVRVPWNRKEKQFYQGTQHCKLITLAAMEHWMKVSAFRSNALLLPATDTECQQPHSMTSNVGSCLFYFAPANAMFCQDYSGSGWNRSSAQEECSQRHAGIDALRAAKNRYAGAGGLFSTSSCAERGNTPPLNGTCVFHCRKPDETLWHVTGPTDPRMTRACDLFGPHAPTASD